MNPADSSPSPPTSRRWLRLSLRGLMILVLIIGGFAGWAAHKIRTQRAAVAVLKAAKQSIRYDYQVKPLQTVNGRYVYQDEPSAPRWLRRIVGDELFQEVGWVSLGQPVTPEVIDAVAKCGRITRFTMSGSATDAECVRLLQSLPAVEQMILQPFLVTDAVLKQVARLSKLREFHILGDARDKRTSPATDDGFAALAGSTSLEFVQLRYSPNLTDAGAARLAAGLPRLHRLQLNTGLSSVATTLPFLHRHHPNLQLLGLDRSGVTDEDLRAVEAMTGLEVLEVQGCKQVTDAGLAHLRPLIHLRSLHAQGTGVTDEGLKHLAGLTQLALLSVGSTKVTDAGLNHLAPLTKLQKLFLDRTLVTDAGMPAIAQLANLEDLWLNGLPGLTDAGLVPLRKSTRLRRLDLRGSAVTPEGIEALRSVLPNLTQLQSGPLPVPRPVPTAGSNPQ